MMVKFAAKVAAKKNPEKISSYFLKKSKKVTFGLGDSQNAKKAQSTLKFLQYSSFCQKMCQCPSEYFVVGKKIVCDKAFEIPLLGCQIPHIYVKSNSSYAIISVDNLTNVCFYIECEKSSKIYITEPIHPVEFE